LIESLLTCYPVRTGTVATGLGGNEVSCNDTSFEDYLSAQAKQSGYPVDLYHRTHEVLQLLPGLKLDVLTVFAHYAPQTAYETLDKLVKEGNGWKELRYLSHRSDLLSYTRDYVRDVNSVVKRYYWENPPDVGAWYPRSPQPSSWVRNLQARDGHYASSSVLIYRATDADNHCCMFQPEKRVIFEQRPSHDETETTFGD
jgi:hypothetical protein